MENKSQIVNDALNKYFFEEKQNYKNDLQIIKDFNTTAKGLEEKIDMLSAEIAILKTRMDLVFKMTLYSGYSVGIIRSENNKKSLIDEMQKVKDEYKKLQDGINSLAIPEDKY
jgi:predicted  nucleic acid-binding Zn-ribbon protein